MQELSLSDRVIKTPLKAFVMGIVNVTPDSFYEGSRGGLEKALKLVEEGADIIDFGAESTRPGSSFVSAQEELSRLIPVLKEFRKYSSVPVSIDTRKKIVMEEAFNEGADILNDVSAMEDDCKIADFVSQKKIPVILMHSRKTFGENEEAIFNEVNDYLLSRAKYAESKGIETNKIILDPGIGFEKDLLRNSSLVKNLQRLGNQKYQVMMALSRKRFIGDMTGRDVTERLSGTLAADIISVLKGASYVRVHDVKETIDTLKVLEYTL